MQSGISASSDLITAFSTLLSSPSQRGLLVSISTSPESLVPSTIIPSNTSSSDLTRDLEALTPHIKENVATYVILKQDGAERAGCVAITYVPDKAPVRQKMLYASTRLTLTRELGTEHFPHTLFATLPAELSPTGFSTFLHSSTTTAPPTASEEALASIKEAEAQSSIGTTTRHGGHASGSSSVALPLAAEAKTALEGLARGDVGVVVLAIEVTGKSETLVLDRSAPAGTGPGEVAGLITGQNPRYTFFAYTSPSSDEQRQQVLFIYTCPYAAKIKERMLYAASKNGVVNSTAREVGVVVDRKMEGGGPEDLEGGRIEMECGLGSAGEGRAGEGEAATAAGGGARGFAKPKRPGRR